MCGIAGIVRNAGTPVCGKMLDRMVACLEHRGPDDGGSLVEGWWGLGHRRLAIIDLSREGRQPMTFGDTTIVYNGELYNYRELRDELEGLGRVFRSSSDTEVLLQAYEEWGEACLERFVGMWAFAMVDRTRKTLFCARDRFGIKPFYYAQTDDGFLFASECGALLEAGVSRAADMDTVAQYVVTGLTDHSERTFFDAIRQLPPGCHARVDFASGALAIERYYDLAATLASPPAKAGEYRAAVEDAVRLRLRSDVPVGTCLSGGIDSSVVAALGAREAQRLGRGRFFAVTARVTEGAPDETPFAGAVAEHCGLDWEVVTATAEDAIRQLDACLEAQGEPVGGPSVFLQYCVMQRARERGIKVLLDGQGGDESLLGYERYYPVFFAALARRLRFFRATREFLLACRRSRLGLRSLLSYTAYFSSLALRRRVLRGRVHGFDGDFVRRGLAPLDCLAGLFGRVEELQVLELTSFQLPHLLRYEDRNSMIHSVEARVPLVDHRAVEAALRLPLSDKIRGGYTKHALRELAADVVPSSIAWRRSKVAFEAPTAVWLDRLEPQVSEAIAGSPLLRRVISGSSTALAHPKLRWPLYNLAVWERQHDVRS